jgi:hypothetical protein
MNIFVYILFKCMHILCYVILFLFYFYFDEVIVMFVCTALYMAGYGHAHHVF